MKSYDPNRLITLPEGARRSGLSVRQIRRGRDESELVVYEIGNWPRVRWGDLLAWIESRRARPTGHAEARVAEVLQREGEQRQSP